MKKGLRLAGLIVSLLAAAYFARFAYQTLSTQDLDNFRDPRLLGAVVLAAVACFLIVPVSSWAWQGLLGSLSCTSSLLTLNAIMGVTQIGKYVPGNVAQHIGRSAWSLRRGIPSSALFISLAVEFLLAAAMAGLIGASALTMYLLPHGNSLHAHLPLLGLAAVTVLASVVGLTLAIKYIPQLTRRFFPNGVTHEIAPPSIRAMLRAALAYSANYILIGISFFCIAKASGSNDSASPVLFVAAFSLSWLAGFVTPGAPAGLGIREAAMAAILAPFIEHSVALSAIVAFRIASTAGDLFSLLWGGIANLCARDSGDQSTT